MILGKPRWPWRRLLTAALAAVAIFLYWNHVAERGERAVARDLSSTAQREGAQRDGAQRTEPDGPRAFGRSVGFADQRRLDQHFDKHGAEFGRITLQDYLHQAQLLRDTRVGGPVLEAVRPDGVITRFDRQTGAFIAFNRDGVIRTFFKPNDGERYWRRQADRQGPDRD
jgi:pyocin large subunit-like protein